jgi:hypothetical protein
MPRSKKPKKPVAHIETTPLGIGGKLRVVVFDEPPPRDVGPLRKAHAAFQLWGDAVEQQFWTDYFGCPPTEFYVKGTTCDPMGREFTPEGKPFGRRKSNGWELSSKLPVDSDELGAHVAYLIDKLGLPRPDFQQLIRDRSISARMFCFLDNTNGDRSSEIDEKLLKVLQISQIEFDVDEYPQEVWIVNKDRKKLYKAWI